MTTLIAKQGAILKSHKLMLLPEPTPKEPYKMNLAGL